MNEQNPVEPILNIRDLGCDFSATKGPFYARRIEVVQALKAASFKLYPGKTVGIVGESGSGKSTLARCIMRLERPTEGHVEFGGIDLATADDKALRPLRPDMQMVFQDPWASLNPRHTVGQILREPWQIHSGIVAPDTWDARVAELLNLVGLDPSFAHRYPSQFSGGQRQRVSIARALALQPKVLILDEAVSALDVSVQAQILNLLADLQAKLGMAYLFISHDLSVVQHLCHDIGVMYLGRIVEFGAVDDVFNHAGHPYTRALLSAMPDAPADQRIVLEGEVPSPLNPPSGCGFRTRCPLAKADCAVQQPDFTPDAEARHRVACFHPVKARPAR